MKVHGVSTPPSSGKVLEIMAIFYGVSLVVYQVVAAWLYLDFRAVLGISFSDSDGK